MDSAAPTSRASRALAVSAIALAAVATPWRVLMHPGWPMNDESMNFFERIEGFRRAFRAGSWYPVWTPFAHHGWGSPYPLFYHRLYTTVAAPLSMALDAFGTNSVIWTVKILVVALLFLGGMGMRRLLLASGASETIAVCGAVLLIVAPYTRTNWFARCAFAELTANMLLPWIYAELCLFVQGRRRWIFLAVELAVLFHAHSILFLFFLYGAIPLAIASAVGPNRNITWGGATREWKSIVAACVVLGAAVVPVVIVSSRLMLYFATAVMTKNEFHVGRNFSPFSYYIVDEWDPERPRSFEINRYVVLALVVLGLLPGMIGRFRWQIRVPLFPFMLIWTAVCVVLQLKTLRGVYRYIPESRYFQFAWRLMCFISVGSIFVLSAGVRSLLAGKRWERNFGRAVIAIVVALSVLTFNRAAPIEDKMYSEADIKADFENLDGPLGAGEYQLHGMERHDMDGLLRPFVTTDDCPSQPRTVRELGDGEFVMAADEAAPCHISLRQFQTPILAVAATNATVTSEIPSREFAVELGAGHSEVRIRAHSFWELLVWSIENPAVGSHRNIDGSGL